MTRAWCTAGSGCPVSPGTDSNTDAFAPIARGPFKPDAHPQSGRAGFPAAKGAEGVAVPLALKTIWFVRVPGTMRQRPFGECPEIRRRLTPRKPSGTGQPGAGYRPGLPAYRRSRADPIASELRNRNTRRNWLAHVRCSGKSCRTSRHNPCNLFLGNSSGCSHIPLRPVWKNPNSVR